VGLLEVRAEVSLLRPEGTLRLARLVNFAHAAGANERQNLVSAKASVVSYTLLLSSCCYRANMNESTTGKAAKVLALDAPAVAPAFGNELNTARATLTRAIGHDHRCQPIGADRDKNPVENTKTEFLVTTGC
jgi:hypothetical protein